MLLLLACPLSLCLRILCTHKRIIANIMLFALQHNHATLEYCVDSISNPPRFRHTLSLFAYLLVNRLMCCLEAHACFLTFSTFVLHLLFLQLSMLQTEAYTSNQRLEDFKKQMNFNQEELQQWVLATKQKEDDAEALKK